MCDFVLVRSSDRASDDNWLVYYSLIYHIMWLTCEALFSSPVVSSSFRLRDVDVEWPERKDGDSYGDKRRPCLIHRSHLQVWRQVRTRKTKVPSTVERYGFFLFVYVCFFEFGSICLLAILVCLPFCLSLVLTVLVCLTVIQSVCLSVLAYLSVYSWFPF